MQNLLNRNAKLLLLIVFIAYTYVFVQFSVDDSLITFRYAKNLMEFGVWNWNPTNYDYVESYTNAIYAFFTIIPQSVGINPSIFFKLLHLILFIYFIKRIYSFTSNNIIIFYIFSFAGIYVHMYSGLETFLFVVSIFELYFIVKNKNRKYDRVLFYFLIVLLPFIRPEGILFAFVYLYLYRKNYDEDKLFYKNTLFIVLFWFVYFMIRFNYFEFMLPNTFYVKSGNSFDIEKYIITLYQFKFEFLFLVVSFFAIKNFDFRVLVILVSLILFFYAKSDLQMNYANRFSFQVVFPLLLIVLVEFINIKQKIYKVFLVFLFIVFSFLSFKSSLNVIKNQYSNTLYILHEMSEKLSRYKKDNILLIGDAGIVPYKSNWETIDYIGLANSYIAHNKKIDITYLESKKPTLLFLYSHNKKLGEFDFKRHHQPEIINYLKKYDKEYQKLGYITWSNNYYYAIYLNKDNEDFNILRTILNNAIVKSNVNNMPTDWSTHIKNILRLEYFKDELH